MREKQMKGITCCGECGSYDWKKHRCSRPCKDEGDAQSNFYADCPLPDVAPVVHGEWREDTDPADGDLRCTHCGVAWPKFVQDQIAKQGIWTLQTLFKYCPRCGTKMDKEDET